MRHLERRMRHWHRFFFFRFDLRSWSDQIKLTFKIHCFYFKNIPTLSSFASMFEKTIFLRATIKGQIVTYCVLKSDIISFISVFFDHRTAKMQIVLWSFVRLLILDPKQWKCLCILIILYIKWNFVSGSPYLCAA